MADDTEDDWQTEAKERYKAARTHWSAWREEARQCFQYYAGHQWSEEDRAHLARQMRPAITFNRIAPLVDAVLGHEANNRKEVQFIPRQLGDARVAEVITQASNYFRDQCDASHEESDAFRDAIVSGIGCTQNRLDDQRNPEWDLVKERVDPLEILVDPASKKPNFDDRRYLFRRKRFAKSEIRQRWPDFAYVEGGDWDDDTEDQLVDRTPGSAYRRDSRDDATEDKGVLVVEYQWQDTEIVHVVTRPDTGETSQIAAADWTEEHDKMVQETGLQHAQKTQMTIRRAFFIGDQAAQSDVVSPKYFTYNFITGKRDHASGMWFGIVRSLIDPQNWANKWLSQMLHIVNSNAKGGVMAEKSAIDVSEFEKKWADPAGIVLVNDGALKDRRIEPKPPPTWPAGVDKLLEYATTSFNAVSGVNAELLGLADREQPGVLEYQRKQSAVTLLAPLFDSLDRYRKEDGRCWLDMMQRYVSDGRLVRIEGEQGNEQYIQLIKNPDIAEYDVIVDQTSSAPSQKEATWAVISQLGPVLKDVIAGNPQVLLLLLEYSPMPASLVEKLKAIAQQQAQNPQPPPEMQKAMAQIEADKAMNASKMQLEQQKAQADIELKRAQAQAEVQIEHEKMQNQAALEQAKAVSQAQIAIHGQQMQAATQGQGQAMQIEADTALQDRQQRMDAEREQRTQQQDQFNQQMMANQQQLAQMMQHNMAMTQQLAKIMGAPVKLTRNSNGEKIAERVMQ